MKLNERIARLYRGEHLVLRTTLDQADREVATLPRYTPRPAPARVIGKSWETSPTVPKGQDERDRMFLDHVGALRQRWTTFRASVELHLDDEERELETLLISGPDVRAVGCRRIRDTHDELRRLAAAVRSETAFVEHGRRQIIAVLDALDADMRAEEVEILPALENGLDEIATGTPVPARWRTSDDVARSLRQKVPVTKEQPPELEPADPKPATGLFGPLIRRFLGKD